MTDIDKAICPECGGHEVRSFVDMMRGAFGYYHHTLTCKKCGHQVHFSASSEPAESDPSYTAWLSAWQIKE